MVEQLTFDDLFVVPTSSATQEMTSPAVYVSPDKPFLDEGKILSVGDKVSKVYLGECKVAAITKVEGRSPYIFYRTDQNICYDVKDGYISVEENMKIAEENRKKYKNIQPVDLTNRFTVVFPDALDSLGHIQWAQIGFFGDYLFWKGRCTYQFCDYLPKGMAKKMYDKQMKDLERKDLSCGIRYEVSNEEMPMERLYLYNETDYGEAEYAYNRLMPRDDIA